MIFIDYVGKRDNKVAFSFRKDGKRLGIMNVDYKFPYTTYRDSEKAAEVLEIIDSNQELAGNPHDYYDWNKQVAHILLHPSQAKLWRETMKQARKKSFISQPRITSFLKWGFNPIFSFNGFPRDSYKFTPFWNHKVILSSDLERELEEKGEVERKDLTDLNLQDYLTNDEIKSQRMAFYDSETTQFQSGDDKIDWGTLLLVENGKIIRGEHHTIRNPKGDSYNGFKIIHHNSAQEILENGVSKSIMDFDPWIIFGFNANFDFYKVMQRTDAELKIDFEGKRPRKKVSLDTRERFLIPGREIIDVCSLSKFYFRHLPNHKLNTVMNHLSEIWGIPWEGKLVNYDELARLSISNNQQDLEKVMDYNKGDVLSLYGLMFNPKSRLIENTADIARIANISLTEASNREFSVETVRDKSHFIALGIHKDTGFGGKLKMDAAKIYSTKERRFKQKLLNQQDSKNHTEELSDGLLEVLYGHRELEFKSSILNCPKVKKGTYENVSQLYVPFGIFSQQILLHRFPEARDFIYIYNTAKEPERKHGLGQWISGLAEKLFIDAYFFEDSSKDFNNMLNEFSLDKNFVQTLFKGNFQQFMAEYRRKYSSKRKSEIIERLSVIDPYPLLNKPRQRNLWDSEALEMPEITPEDALESLLDQFKLKEAHNSGFLGTHGCSVSEFREHLQYQVDKMWKSFSGNFINMKGDYIFIENFSAKENCPLIAIKNNFPVTSKNLGEIIYENQDTVVGAGVQRARKKTAEQVSRIKRETKDLLAGKFPLF